MQVLSRSFGDAARAARIKFGYTQKQLTGKWMWMDEPYLASKNEVNAIMEIYIR